MFVFNIDINSSLETAEIGHFILKICSSFEVYIAILYAFIRLEIIANRTVQKF